MDATTTTTANPYSIRWGWLHRLQDVFSNQICRYVVNLKISLSNYTKCLLRSLSLIVGLQTTLSTLLTSTSNGLLGTNFMELKIYTRANNVYGIISSITLTFCLHSLLAMIPTLFLQFTYPLYRILETLNSQVLFPIHLVSRR